MYAKNIRSSAKREIQTERSAKSATIESLALDALKLASDENVPAKRADFYC